MKDTALFFLHKVAKTTNNPFAIALFNKLKNAKKDENLKEWKLLDLPFDANESLGELDNNRIWTNQDYRFLHLYLKGFRKFPFEKFYGVPFGSKQEESSCPPSVLIYGGNGTGKTSVFSALEYLFTEQISAAKKQRLKKNEIKDFIPYAKGHINEVLINVTTKSNHFSFGPNEQFHSDLGHLSLCPFFCSEYDVDNLLENKLTGYIYEQMGYGLATSIIKQLDDEISDVISHHEDLGDINTINNQLADLNRKIEVYQKFKNPFLDILSELQRKTNWKENAKEMLSELSKRFVHQKKQKDLSDKEKPLNKNSLKKEKKIVCILKGDEFAKEYSDLERILQAKINDYDPIEIDSWTQSVEERIFYFNLERDCLRDFIQEIYNNNKNENVLPNYGILRSYYDTILKNNQEDIDSKEKAKLELEKYVRYNTNKVVYDEFFKSFKFVIYGTINKITDTFKDFVKEIANLFLMYDEELNFDFDENSGQFNMQIRLKTVNSSAVFQPKEYLNTFRYKLYCMTLKFVIAFTIKKFYNLNFPIVIDDIFYSSDFSHRNMVRDYFRTLFIKHDELFSEEDQKLQVIFFSHDEVAIEAAYRGIRDVTPNVDRLMLYDYQDAGDEDDVITPVNPERNDKEPIKYTKLIDSLDI